jgi:hypothetical protein
MPVGHPNQYAYNGTLKSYLIKVETLINSTTEIEGLYLSNITDFVHHLDDSKYVSVEGLNLVVTKAVSPGLTLYNESGLSSNIVIDGKVTTIVNRNKKVMLPAMSEGTHSFIYSNSYPRISAYTNGSLIRDGCYDIPNKTMSFEIYDDDGFHNETNVSITRLSDTTNYMVSKDGHTLYPVKSSNGSLALNDLKEGVYTLTETTT